MKIRYSRPVLGLRFQFRTDFILFMVSFSNRFTVKLNWNVFSSLVRFFLSNEITVQSNRTRKNIKIFKKFGFERTHACLILFGSTKEAIEKFWSFTVFFWKPVLGKENKCSINYNWTTRHLKKYVEEAFFFNCKYIRVVFFFGNRVDHFASLEWLYAS